MASLSISRRDARRSALTALIDYAGLFPPAALSMREAVDEYRAARGGPDGWIVDRFICPAGRLEELLGILVPTMTTGEEPWRLAITGSAGWLETLTSDAGAVRTFIDATASAATVDLVELRVPVGVTAGQLSSDAARFLQAYPAIVFFELSWATAPMEAMDALAGLRTELGRALGVKLRCGGLSPELFPSPEEAARFIVAAAARSLPLKATAGLHHPVRHLDTETGFHHHGFLNVLAANALAHGGESEGSVAAALAEEDPSAFGLDRSGLSWRGHRVGANELDEIRRTAFVAYGSCSFAEPVADLTASGVLPLEVSS
jgi:hypothetical protein